jgi:hypothetical protein
LLGITGARSVRIYYFTVNQVLIWLFFIVLSNYQLCNIICNLYLSWKCINNTIPLTPPPPPPPPPHTHTQNTLKPCGIANILCVNYGKIPLWGHPVRKGLW